MAECLVLQRFVLRAHSVLCRFLTCVANMISALNITVYRSLILFTTLPTAL